ncbi:MAG: hypothetical protein WAU86_18845 [Oricola sp.]
MTKRIHAIAGAIALATILSFWISTVVSELFGSAAQVAAVKTFVLYGLGVLIPAMAAAGGTGFRLGAKWRSGTVNAKKTRMKIIAATGVLVLVPSAVFLAMKTGQGAFDRDFMIVQAIELAAGASNIALLALNMRDGMAMRRRRIPKPA